MTTQLPIADRYRFAAFISYRHLAPDQRIARALHRLLEDFRTPAELVAKGYPARVGKVFLDHEELAAGTRLSQAIAEALDDAAFLIVVCSPRAPASAWMCQELEHLIARGREDRILTLLIEGEPNVAFPAPIADAEIVAADVRAAGLGGTLRRLRFEVDRIIAPLLGCGVDELRERVRRRALRRQRQWIAVLTLATVLFAAITLAAVIQWREARAQRELAVSRLNDALGVARYILITVDRDLRSTNVGRVRADLLEKTRVLVDRLAPGASGERRPEIRWVQAAAAQQAGDLARQQGELDAALQHYHRVIELTRKLLADAPQEPEYMRALAIGFDRVGDIARDRQAVSEARDAFEQALELSVAVAAQAPEQALALRNVAVMRLKIADLLRDEGQKDEAISQYERVLQDLRPAIEAGKEVPFFERTLAVAKGRLAIALGDRDPTRALALDEEALAIMERLFVDAPDDTALATDVARGHARLAAHAGHAEQFEAARSHFRRATEVIERVVSSDATNEEARGELRTILQEQADFLLDRGDLEAAEASYRLLLEGLRGDVEPDMQQVRAVTETRMGEIALADQRPFDAVDWFQQSIAHWRALVDAYPEVLSHRTGLVVAAVRAAGGFAQVEDWARARSFSKTALATTGTSLDAPTSLLFQRAVIHANLVRVAARTGDATGADEHAQQVRRLLEHFEAHGLLRDDPQVERMRRQFGAVAREETGIAPP